MTDVVEKSNGQLEEKTEANYANLTDDTGELDYEPSEPDNSIKDVVSEVLTKFLALAVKLSEKSKSQ